MSTVRYAGGGKKSFPRCSVQNKPWASSRTCNIYSVDTVLDLQYPYGHLVHHSSVTASTLPSAQISNEQRRYNRTRWQLPVGLYSANQRMFQAVCWKGSSNLLKGISLWYADVTRGTPGGAPAAALR